MNLSYQDIGQVCAGFQAAAGLGAGKLCKITDNGTVGSCAKNDVFNGVTMKVRNGMATVALRGFVTVKYAGTAPALGECKLVAASAFEVQVAETGKSCLVVSVDTANQEVTVLM